MVELRKITILDDNMKDCIALDVAPEKKGSIWSNAITLAVAYSRGKVMECRSIHVHGEMVGLISYNHFVESSDFKETCYRIRPVMIDKNQLGKGYEEVALRQLLKEVQTKPHGEATAIFATYAPEEDDMAKLYEKAGFTKTGMKWQDPDNDNIIVRMGL
ncbi:MAG: GNAT family N-acetyltransferase [Defluviitaleaceae bacterium]|nr:GNAT family N-acetyltransferase [Defluviitaleaceae bacterium]